MVKKKSNIGWWILGLVLVFAIGILAGKYLINQDVLTSPGSGGGDSPQLPKPCSGGCSTSCYVNGNLRWQYFGRCSGFACSNCDIDSVPGCGGDLELKGCSSTPH